MDILSLLLNKYLLLGSATTGVIWLVVVFGFSFLCIHVAKLAKIGWKQQQKTPPNTPPPQEKKLSATTCAQEPIYYIVERKKRRSKPSYGEPKEIRFKKD